MIDVQPTAGVALVVGGGRVASRKVAALLDAGFPVEVIAPEVSASLPHGPSVIVTRRAFAVADVPGRALVFACTDDREVNALVVAAARRLGILALAADDPQASSFHSVALHRDGDLLVGVSTGGASPSLASEIRTSIATCLGGGWASRIAAARDARLGGRRRGGHDRV